jgi:photosystem II stability/assembly factor-like uncharacterized protein
LAFAKASLSKAELRGINGANTYIAAGPILNGGRTRALAFDKDYNGTTNRTLIAGGVSSGLFKSTDGGVNWQFVHPQNETHNVTCVAQDPRVGNRNVWYAGSGEYTGASPAIPLSTVYLGNGLLKSTDNGNTWTPLTSTQGNPNSFDNTFDLCYRIVVHPTNGNVYVATHGRVMRSTDGGTTFSSIFGTNTSFTTSSNRGMTDVAITSTGKVYVILCGNNPDATQIGLWESSTGDAGSFNRIAGGAVDQPTGWKAPAAWGRPKLSLAPSDNNILYILYENFNSSTTPASLFRMFSGLFGNTFSENRQANLYGLRNGSIVDRINLQGGYDIDVAVHPTDPEVVYIAGTNIYRSNDAFASTNSLYYMGGYSSSTFSDPEGISHPDQHIITFDPTNADRLVVGNDGGFQITPNARATTVTWQNGNAGYQSLQYYYVAMDPTAGVNAFAGGAQDNGTAYRDVLNLFNLVTNPDDHIFIIGGDGCSTGMTGQMPSGNRYVYGGIQLGFMVRYKLNSPRTSTTINPTGASGSPGGLFVTLFGVDQDNNNNAIYARNDSLWATTSAETVTPATWSLMTGVAPSVAGTITALGFTRGNYSASSSLYFGNNIGKVYRMDDPFGSGLFSAPVDITPILMPSSYVYDIAVNPRSADSVMVVVANYNVESIFITGNARSASPTWTAIEGNLTTPSIRSCEFAITPNGKTELYVGTSVGLYSTDNIQGGQTVWVNEGTGAMKTAIVNSMAYRPSDRTLLVGTHGNGMFYTQISNSPTNVSTITNDKSFIVNAYPTLTNNKITFAKGNQAGISKIDISIADINGRMVLNKTAAYQTGELDLSKLSNGVYILNIWSDNKKYRFVQKFIKQ